MKRSLLALLATGLVGCSSHPSPGVRVLGATLSETSDAGSVVTITLEASNTGPKPIPLRDVRYSVTIDGAAFEGVRSAQTTLNRYSTATIVLPAAFLASIPPGAHLRVNGSIVYVPPGTISQTLLEAEIVEPTVSFGGELDVTPSGQ